MSQTFTQPLGTRTQLTSTALSTLASATYLVTTATYTPNTNKPLDVVVEVNAGTSNTPAGNKQVVYFIKESLDGTNFRSGPESGTATADEPNLRWLGTLPMNTLQVVQKATFSVVNSLGYVPYAFKIVTKNDCGVALSTSQGENGIWTAEVSGASA